MEKVKIPELDGISQSAVLTLQSCSSMEFLQLAATAIRDLGIIDLNGWSGGFDELYTQVWNAMFDEERNLHAFLHPVLLELRNNSNCGADRFTLAGALARVGATYAFVSMAMDRNK